MRHARYLSPAENAALSRVFYDDAFIEGMGRVRGIADHVETGETVLRHTDGSAFTITAATSSAVLFASRLVYLTDKEGVRQPWDHLKQLTEAERRIRKAFARAKG